MQDPQRKHILFNIAKESSFDDMLAKYSECKERMTDLPEAQARILPSYVATKKTRSLTPNKKRLSNNNGAQPGLIHDSTVPESRSEELNEHSQGKVLSINEISERRTYGYFENNRYIPVVSPNVARGPSTAPRRLNENTSRRAVAPPAQADRIPINAAGHRLDPLLRVPTSKERAGYKSRTKSSRLCSRFHLTGYCHVKDCRYDHGHIAPAQLHVLQHKLKEWPCYYEGTCRLEHCYHGHICLVQGCKGNKYKGCRFGSEAHNIDLEIHEWVKPMPRRTDRPEERMDYKSVAKVDSAQGSMETWPMMVADLIEM
ncbi:hypothetical protein DE146DRAFT_657071 [Phaeosphaeria sp. MPI-PUGE-AT-0046c]|nr:hypothetical protein DE146DRAFT_657071 [Phaeosphaeria sp. MPI-PUGE-AT-0046c]